MWLTGRKSSLWSNRNMHEVLLGAAISGIVGFVIALPAIVREARSKQEDLPILVDVKLIWNYVLKPREVFVISLLLHLLVATLVGGFYVWFAGNGWLFITHAPFALHSVMIFTVATWIVAGLILYPLLGMGFFAHRQGRHMWFEMLVTHFLIGLGFWLGVQYYQPMFF